MSFEVYQKLCTQAGFWLLIWIGFNSRSSLFIYFFLKQWRLVNKHVYYFLPFYGCLIIDYNPVSGGCKENCPVVWVKFEFLFGNHGCYILWAKETRDHPACYRCTFQKPASKLVWGYINAINGIMDVGMCTCVKYTINAEGIYMFWRDRQQDNACYNTCRYYNSMAIW